MLSLTKRNRMAVVLCLALILVVLIALSFVVPIYDDICSKNEYTNEKECARYHLTPVALWHVIKALNDYGVAITALATGAIAWFTWTLRRSTDRLWDVSNQQVEISRRTLTELERPWLFVNIAPQIYVENSAATAKFTVVNHGRAPGIIQIIDVTFSTGFEPVSQLRDYSGFSGTTLGEGEKWEDLRATADPEISQRMQQHGLYMSPAFIDENLFFTIRIEYTDAPGNPHVSRFGWRFDLSSRRWVGLRDPKWFYTE